MTRCGGSGCTVKERGIAGRFRVGCNRTNRGGVINRGRHGVELPFDVVRLGAAFTLFRRAAGSCELPAPRLPSAMLVKSALRRAVLVNDGEFGANESAVVPCELDGRNNLLELVPKEDERAGRRGLKVVGISHHRFSLNNFSVFGDFTVNTLIV